MSLHCHSFNQHIIILSRLHTTCLDTVTSSYNMTKHCHTFTQHGITMSRLHTTFQNIMSHHHTNTLSHWYIFYYTSTTALTQLYAILFCAQASMKLDISQFHLYKKTNTMSHLQTACHCYVTLSLIFTTLLINSSDMYYFLLYILHFFKT